MAASKKYCANHFRYEAEFFENVVNGREIVSWAAVDRSRPNDENDELIGFVTARIVLAKESEVCSLRCYNVCTIHNSHKKRL